VFCRSMFSPDYRNWWISILSGWACSRRIRSYRCGYASCSEMSLSCVGTSGFPARQPTQRAPCPYIRYFIDSCIQRWLRLVGAVVCWSSDDNVILIIRGFHRKIFVIWWRLEMSELHSNAVAMFLCHPWSLFWHVSIHLGCSDSCFLNTYWD